MERLSSPISEIGVEYDAVVVGSGYGGAIAACRLARAGRPVCVLERGDELRPGDYPERFVGAARQAQAHVGGRHFGPRNGLFDFHLGRDISVLVGCGLGGTSLINANVALEVDPRIFDDARWPAELRGTKNPLEAEYERARGMLGSKSYPVDAPMLAKLRALERSADALGHPMSRPRINVTFTAGVNAAGVVQAACTGCGNCVTGCNDGAKNTLLMNYLPDARAHGAHIFAGAEVWAVEPTADSRWRVSFQARGQGREGYGAPTQFVVAKVVVLAAGTLGSSAILLRSARAGLPVSNQIGERFSGNGDVIGFAFDSDARVNGVGQTEHGVLNTDSPGPCITGLIDLRDTLELDDGLVIEDAVLPSALAGVLAVGLPVADAAVGDRRSRARSVLDGLRGILHGAHSEALGRTLSYMVMSSDDGDGRLVLDGDTVAVDWPDVGSRAVYRHDNDELHDASDAINATWVRDPFSTKRFGDALVSVHPLGGCVMADGAENGVVDHRGAVFSGPNGKSTHRGLYVADGSIIPRALGVNPLLTISALAERISALLIQEHGWTPEPGTADPAAQAVASKPGTTSSAAPTTPGLRFTERMSGYFSPKVHSDCEAGYQQGRADGTRIEYVVSIDVDDVEKLVADPSIKARLSGTVSAPALAAGRRLTVAGGWFQLFDPDRDHVETSVMRYHLPLTAENGTRFVMEGEKTIHHNSLCDAWPATTTLDAKIRAADGTPVGAGVLHMEVSDLAHMLATMRVPRARNGLDAAKHLGRFMRRFAEELVANYGGVLAESHSWDETGATIKRRKLRLPQPALRYCHHDGTWDDQPGPDAFLRLARYPRGSRGPVILAPGFGMSTAAFVTDTIATNLCEYLFEHDYDVWLLDFRWSPDLASSRTSFNIDDVATVDWPKAVAEVRRIANVDDVQVIAHCVGSMSFLMAMLKGMTGVRSAICSQVTTHPRMTWFHRFLVAIHTSHILQDLGSRTISPDAKRTATDEALDLALRLVPTKREDRCASAVCRWINTFYGPTHYHAQLNQDTHDDMARLFGVADLDALNHIGLIVHNGRALDHKGRDVYLPHVDRLKLPILFLAGDQNRIFLPSTSKHTYDWLVKANGANLYKRTVIHNYAHLDGFIGRDASSDIYPIMLKHLEAHPAN